MSYEDQDAGQERVQNISSAQITEQNEQRPMIPAQQNNTQSALQSQQQEMDELMVGALDEVADSSKLVAAVGAKDNMSSKIDHLRTIMWELTGMELTCINQINEETRPSDPVAGLLQSQINFYFHIVFFVACVLVKRSTDHTCFQRIAGAWVEYHDDYGIDDYPEDFMNNLIDRIQWLHLTCFILLLVSKTVHIFNQSSDTIPIASIFAFLSIPFYFIIVYQSENILRRQMLVFSEGSTNTDFTITWENSFASVNGTACVAEEPGNIMAMLWIEIIAFQVAVLVIFIVTSYYFFVGMVIHKDRNEDLILCRDVRMIDNSAVGRYRYYPTYHLFNQDMSEVGNTRFFTDRTLSPAHTGSESKVANEQGLAGAAQKRLDVFTKIFQDQKQSDNLSFYRIKGSELDAESRKEIEDADVLNQVVKKDDEVRVHLFMFIISVLLITVSHLTMHDDFTIATLSGLRFEKYGWEPVFCTYDESEKKFLKLLLAPIILHSLVLIWWFVKGVFNIGDRANRPCYLHPAWFILLGNIAVTVVGYIMMKNTDKDIENDHCKSEFSISATWFRIDFILTFVSLFEEFFDDYINEAKDLFNLHYKCEYLHQTAHKRELTGQEDDLSLADVFKLRVQSAENSIKLKGLDKKKSVRINQPTANLVKKTTIIKNMQRAKDSYNLGLKLEDIVFENESETSTDQRFLEYQNNILSDSVKTLSIGGSIYEHAFWIMYHEDCPKVINETIQRCMFSMAVTLFLTYYIIGARTTAVSNTVYYGSWQLNIVRTICILLLHLQMYPETYACRNMLQFALNNAEQFTGQSALFPILLSLFKLAVALGIECGNLYLLMYYDNEWSCIIFYVSLAVIASLEGKMMNIVRTSNKNYGAKPLTYLANSSNGAIGMARRYYKKWDNGTIDSGWFQVILVTVFCIIDAILGLVYHTFYYYLLCFSPVFVIFYSRLADSVEHQIDLPVA